MPLAAGLRRTTRKKICDEAPGTTDLGHAELPTLCQLAISSLSASAVAKATKSPGFMGRNEAELTQTPTYRV